MPWATVTLVKGNGGNQIIHHSLEFSKRGAITGKDHRSQNVENEDVPVVVAALGEHLFVEG